MVVDLHSSVVVAPYFSSLLAPGSLLAGRFRVERVLGRGGMGVVVAAHHLALDERVAVKLLLPEGAKRSDYVKRFLREARAVIKIKSEHVARVMDFGMVDGTATGLPFIVMEYLEGCDLEALVKHRGALPVAEAVDYVLQACEALAEAHFQGIVHRDLKPANLFLCTRSDRSSLVKVLDFGISKFASGPPGDAEVTRAADTMGTPRYMSPEQLKSARDVDARTDVWSLGVVLFRLLTGSLPFRGDGIAETSSAILNDEPRSLRAILPDVDPALEAAIARCLAKEREARFASVQELVAALWPFAPQALAGERTPPPRFPLLCDPLCDPLRDVTFEITTVETVSPASTTAKRFAPTSRRARGRIVAGLATAATLAGLALVGAKLLGAYEGAFRAAERHAAATVPTVPTVPTGTASAADVLASAEPLPSKAAGEEPRVALSTLSTLSLSTLPTGATVPSGRAADAPLSPAEPTVGAPTPPSRVTASRPAGGAPSKPSTAATPKKDPWDD
jgi:serine/threonine-protein kinase